MKSSSTRQVLLRYFPHTNACPKNSQPCLQTKCKYWVKDKVCWDIEFGNLVEEIFGEDQYHFIHFDKSLERFFLSARIWLEDLTDFKKIPKIVIELGLNSGRLAKKIKEQFNLTDWMVESCCDEGGDDHNLVLVTYANYSDRDKVRKLLKNIKALIPQMIAAEKKINTCDVCGDTAASLTDYGNHSICFRCERMIIVENLSGYVKKAV